MARYISSFHCVCGPLVTLTHIAEVQVLIDLAQYILPPGSR